MNHTSSNAALLEELVACMAIYGDCTFVLSPELLAAVNETQAGDPSSGQSVLAAVNKIAFQVVFYSSSSECCATLRIEAPSEYPLQPLSLHASSLKAPRAWEDHVMQQLKTLCITSAAEGRECLSEAIQVMLESLARQDELGKQPEASSTQQAPQQDLPPLALALLRLDHMRNKGAYTRTIKAWAKELGLTGRLVFQGLLILIVLEGESSDVAQYILRQRTQVVDLDSHGRKCRERMMDVLMQRDCSRRAFDEFRDVELCSAAEVAALLSSVGLGDCLAQLGVGGAGREAR